MIASVTAEASRPTTKGRPSWAYELLLQQSPNDGDLLFSLALINRETGSSSTIVGT